MATKEEWLFLRSNDKTFITNYISVNSDSQYRNLNVNGIGSLTLNSSLSKNVSFDNGKNCQRQKDYNEFDCQESDLKWNKNDKIMFSKTYGFLNSCENEPQNNWKKEENDSTVKNSSNLSLHISAFENSVEAHNFGKNNDLLSKTSTKKNVSVRKIWNVCNQTETIQNSFEFPRQSNGEEVEPEIMQFKASQRLLAPNDDKYQAVIDCACTLGMDDESLTLFLRILSDEEEKFGGPQNSSHWNMLQRLIGHRNAFQNYAQKLVDESRQKGSEKIMKSVQELLGQNCSSVNDSVDFIDNYGRLIRLIFSSANAMWFRLPASAQVQILQFLSRVGECMNDKMLTIIGSFSSGFGSTLVKYSKTVSITLMFIPVAIEVVRSIWKWYKGEISGKQVAKNITSTLGLHSASIGTAFGGPLLGFAGGVAGGCLADVLIDILTREIFDLPKTQALENAYQYLDVHHRASDSEVEAAYKKRRLIDHPDKGGSHEAFCKLQTCYTIIKIDRGKY